jgi:hypothetical protein
MERGIISTRCANWYMAGGKYFQISRFPKPSLGSSYVIDVTLPHILTRKIVRSLLSTHMLASCHILDSTRLL